MTPERKAELRELWAEEASKAMVDELLAENDALQAQLDVRGLLVRRLVDSPAMSSRWFAFLTRKMPDDERTELERILRERGK